MSVAPTVIAFGAMALLATREKATKPAVTRDPAGTDADAGRRAA